MSDVGRVREQNEDSFLVDDQLQLFLVADGMGGHLGGKRASSLTVETVQRFVAERITKLTGAGSADAGQQQSALPTMLAEAIRFACREVYEEAKKDAALQGMGTTLTALLLQSDYAFIGHVGDSRCYLKRADEMLQVTDDHSLVNEQIRAGLLSPDQALASGFKNIITRSVGYEPDVAVDTFSFPVQEGDRLFLCSDGLSNLVEIHEIGQALEDLDLEDVPKAMIKLANARGGDDNITVVCLMIGPGGEIYD